MPEEVLIGERPDAVDKLRGPYNATGPALNECDVAAQVSPPGPDLPSLATRENLFQKLALDDQSSQLHAQRIAVEPTSRNRARKAQYLRVEGAITANTMSEWWGLNELGGAPKWRHPISAGCGVGARQCTDGEQHVEKGRVATALASERR